MKTDRYRQAAFQEFAEQQARFAPVAVRLAQIERAEQLLPTLKPDESYAFPDLIHEITSRPTELHRELVLDGADAVRDVLLFIEHMSDSLNLDASTAPEPVLTQDELSRKYNVAEKTISRWRSRGLGGRRYRFGKRKRVGFLQSLVEKFVSENSEKVSAAARFSNLSIEEREWAIRRARRLARWGANQTQVITRLAKRMGRVPETLRQMLRQHDHEFPTAAIFPNSKEMLSEDEKREIYLAIQSGESPTLIGRRFNRTRSSIHRIAKEYRRELLMRVPLNFFYCDDFEVDDADDVILVAPAELNLPDLELKPQHAPQLPGYISDLYAFPVLTREQEYFLFRKMNYLMFKAKTARDALPKSQPEIAAMDQVDSLLEASQAVKNVLIRCNLRLVVAVARKHQHDESTLFEMISDGNLAMIHALETFDYTRGNKFSTYATWALMRHYARNHYNEVKRSTRFQSTDDETLEIFAEDRASVSADAGRVHERSDQIEAILDHLNEREQEAVSMKFGIGQHVAPQSLDEISSRLGVTKDRARGLLSSAMSKLREIVGSSVADDDASNG